MRVNVCKNNPFLTRKQMGFEDLLYQQYSDRRHSDCGGHRSINTSKAIHLTQANEIIIIVSVGGARPDLHKLHMLQHKQPQTHVGPGVRPLRCCLVYLPGPVCFQVK